MTSFQYPTDVQYEVLARYPGHPCDHRRARTFCSADQPRRVADAACGGQGAIIGCMPRQPAAFVGRSGELAGLTEAVGLRQAIHGLAILFGDAGIGKTWLLRDLLATAEQAGTP